MKTVFKNIFYLFLFLATLSACQSVKDGLTGKKQTNMDEFLVKKKDPLVLPPEFEKLPQPTSAESTPSLDNIDLESSIQKVMGITKNTTNKKEINTSLEKSILEKIKSN